MPVGHFAVAALDLLHCRSRLSVRHWLPISIFQCCVGRLCRGLSFLGFDDWPRRLDRVQPSLATLGGIFPIFKMESSTIASRAASSADG